jgi:hypothetical protein
MKMYGIVNVHVHVFLSLELEMSGQFNAPSALPRIELQVSIG